MNISSQFEAQIGMYFFWAGLGFFILLVITYTFAAQRKYREVAAHFSGKPDLSKKQGGRETIILPKGVSETWSYLENPEFFKKWHPLLREIVFRSGEPFQIEAEMLFRYENKNIKHDDVLVSVVARSENEYIAFRSEEKFFYRFEWLLLESVAPLETRLTIVTNHQLKPSLSKLRLFENLFLFFPVHNAYRNTVRKNLQTLQGILSS